MFCAGNRETKDGKKDDPYPVFPFEQERPYTYEMKRDIIAWNITSDMFYSPYQPMDVDEQVDKMLTVWITNFIPFYHEFFYAINLFHWSIDVMINFL